MQVLPTTITSGTVKGTVMVNSLKSFLFLHLTEAEGSMEKIIVY